MSFQAYLDSIRAKTGKGPDDFKELARAKGFLEPGVKAGTIVAWLKDDFNLGHGHAMAIYGTLKSDGQPRPTTNDKVAQHFSGGRAHWQPTYDKLIDTTSRFGADVTVNAPKSYISLLRGTKKFAIVKATANRFDVGIKLKHTVDTPRLTAAGTWNTMVTHRVAVPDTKAIDDELIQWLRTAYGNA
jgi:hypothetical protein